MLTVPGEGLVKAIGIVRRIILGTVEAFFYSALVLAVVICSSIFLSELIGIGDLNDHLDLPYRGPRERVLQTHPVATHD